MFISYMIRTNAINRNISSGLIPQMTCFLDISHLPTSSLIRKRVKTSEIRYQRFPEELSELNEPYIDISPQMKSFAFGNYKPSQVTILKNPSRTQTDNAQRNNHIRIHCLGIFRPYRICQFRPRPLCRS
jgi:hypothetical protein